MIEQDSVGGPAAVVGRSRADVPVIGSRLSQPGIRDVLATFPTRFALGAAGTTRIRTTVEKRSPHLADTRTDEMWAALDAQRLTLLVETAWSQVIESLTFQRSRRCSNQAS